MSDRPTDDELPPDPWSPPPPPPPPLPEPIAGGTRSPLQHPAFWIGLTILAAVALLTAFLDRV